MTTRINQFNIANTATPELAELTVTGNVTANYFLGDGSQLTGISTSTNQIFNGDSNVDIATANANITMSVAGVGNVMVIFPDGVTVTGNITGNNAVFMANVVLSNLSIGAGGSIDAGNNVISNVAEPVANSDAATKAYVDAQSASGFTIEDDTSNTTIVSGGDTLVMLGTADQVTVLITNTDEITFGLPDNVTIANNLTVTANASADTFLGNISGTTGAFTGNVSGATFLGNISGTTGAFTGNVSGAMFLGNIEGDTAVFTGNVSGDTFLGDRKSVV